MSCSVEKASDRRRVPVRAAGRDATRAPLKVWRHPSRGNLSDHRAGARPSEDQNSLANTRSTLLFSENHLSIILSQNHRFAGVLYRLANSALGHVQLYSLQCRRQKAQSRFPHSLLFLRPQMNKQMLNLEMQDKEMSLALVALPTPRV